MRPHRPVNQYSTELEKKATGWGEKNWEGEQGEWKILDPPDTPLPTPYSLLPIPEKNPPEMVSKAVSSARIPRLFSLS
ncbi:MAG TPA: hypothetical protein DEG17_16645 [Cyanobacteria bacterium UBA11149]|nr:hypothetical protein [Cyanobacteria bacterium UBA11367]HBE56402.1 hypothetical protein [Cyanobacteria bacterium UBA11366]HBK62908.1 hypothetical protein [Cyanobacteria bacterium UBA11166]HBR73867.1 hypothetical protein [Cyanobacteria bacterium UBA11159]HBS69948.1 hypothetical protein [Cyanobacteria bacterium UBA11153]HBW90451.1 hypothetical protein [Cyanobacteria bacterium UBA11149]HCA97113.1 hypothetical protein [Cyanobacteria bacterium UBA9226]